MIARVLLIGLGNVGMLYDFPAQPQSSPHALTHASAFATHEKFVLVGGVDPVSGRRKMFEAQFRTRSFESTEAALAETTPDVVIIASPTSLHRHHVEAVLNGSKPKVIICEKPLAATPLDAEAIVSACERAGVSVFVNYQRRVDAAVLDIRDRLRTTKIRLPLRGTCWYSKGAMHSASHFADLLKFWLGPIESIHLNRPGRTFGSDDAEPDFTLHFPDAEVAFLALPDEKYRCNELHLYAANGALRYGHSGPDIEWRPVAQQQGGALALSGPSDAEMIKGSSHRALFDVAEAISDSLSGRESLLCTGREGANLVATLTTVLPATSKTASP